VRENVWSVGRNLAATTYTSLNPDLKNTFVGEILMGRRIKTSEFKEGEWVTEDITKNVKVTYYKKKTLEEVEE
jgi:hypothetical protein